MIQRFSVVTVALIFALLAGTPALAADEVSDGQWFHAFLNTAEAHAITEGEGVTVAVVDSGVDASHPDLAGSVLPGIDFVSSGGNGQIDTHGHGTAMAGLIAAHGRVKGIAPQAKVLPIRAGAIGDVGSAKSADGIEWAVEHGAKVLSLSWAGPEDDLLLRQEVRAAIDADVVVVAGVGNTPKASSVGYPAAIPGVVAVAGVDRNGNHSTVSVTGPEVVIAAPSDGISTTDRDGTYHVATGTSDATAIVAGAVALIRSKYPDLPATEVVRRLTATATDKGAPGRDSEYGYGVLNLVAALTADLPPATGTTPNNGTKTKAAPPTLPPSQPGSFPWWRIAVPAVIVVGIIAALVWMRRRRT